jgi:hypothetical protein
MLVDQHCESMKLLRLLLLLSLSLLLQSCAAGSLQFVCTQSCF